MKYDLQTISLTVGTTYSIGHSLHPNKHYVCTFAKVTAKGYNFIKSNGRRVFKRNLYANKHQSTTDSLVFILPTFVLITKTDIAMIQITKPSDMSSGTTNFDKALMSFEKQFQDEEKDQEYYHLVIKGEYNRDTCDKIQQAYVTAGWASAKCKTSSENGERAGLTGLQLWKTDSNVE
jgi:hypothetical protein